MSMLSCRSTTSDAWPQTLLRYSRLLAAWVLLSRTLHEQPTRRPWTHFSSTTVDRDEVRAPASLYIHQLDVCGAAFLCAHVTDARFLFSFDLFCVFPLALGIGCILPGGQRHSSPWPRGGRFKRGEAVSARPWKHILAPSERSIWVCSSTGRTDPLAGSPALRIGARPAGSPGL